LLSAYPERVGVQRGRRGEFLLASGRGVFIDPAETLAGSAFIVAAELGGGAGRDRVLLAAAVEPAEIRSALSDRMTIETALEAGGAGRLLAIRRVRLGAVVLEEASGPAAGDAVAEALLESLRRDGLGRLPWSPRARGLQARAAFLRDLGVGAIPDISDAALMADLETFAAPLLEGRRALADIPQADLEAALEARLGWEGLRDLESLAPARFATPAGSSAAIDYAADGGPLAEVRVQEMFGLAAHPTLARGRAPLTLALTSPARRPLQITKDLPGFWAGSWKEVRKDMRGRYPRHPWPEDPVSASPTARAKPRGT
jgi:ATP-dependent helicase HrpB